MFSPLAVADLDGILEYITTSPRAAMAFVEMLKDKCDTLARFPLLGASREALFPGLRMFPVGNYVISIGHKAAQSALNVCFTLPAMPTLFSAELISAQRSAWAS